MDLTQVQLTASNVYYAVVVEIVNGNFDSPKNWNIEHNGNFMPLTILFA